MPRPWMGIAIVSIGGKSLDEMQNGQTWGGLQTSDGGAAAALTRPTGNGAQKLMVIASYFVPYIYLGIRSLAMPR
jgi:hypothetical protein